MLNHSKVFKPPSVGIKLPSSRSNTANVEDTLQWVKIGGEWFMVLKAYPIGATSQAECDQLFIDELKLQRKKKIFITLAHKTQVLAPSISLPTPTLSFSTTGYSAPIDSVACTFGVVPTLFIYFCHLLEMSINSLALPFMPRLHCFPHARGTQNVCGGYMLHPPW